MADKHHSSLLVTTSGKLPGIQQPVALPIRPAPSVAPFFSQGFIARWKGRAVAKNLDVGSTVKEAARRYLATSEAAEAAQQAAELQFERRRSLPMVAEAERATVLATLTRAAMALEAAQYEREQRSVDYLHQQHVDALQWQSTVLGLKTEFATSQARQRRQQQIEEEDHRIEMMQRDLAQLDLIAEITDRIAAARRKRAETAPADNTPEEFRRAWATEERVRVNRSEAEIRIDAIYARARAEVRDLTQDEIEEVDALVNTADAAEDTIRRGAASDL
jgi:hypothetical protein